MQRPEAVLLPEHPSYAAYWVSMPARNCEAVYWLAKSGMPRYTKGPLSRNTRVPSGRFSVMLLVPPHPTTRFPRDSTRVERDQIESSLFVKQFFRSSWRSIAGSGGVCCESRS
jgi:hypothetical protein